MTAVTKKYCMTFCKTTVKPDCIKVFKRLNTSESMYGLLHKVKKKFFVYWFVTLAIEAISLG